MKPKLPNIDVLAFSPHPDDAEIFCGGMLIKLARSGYKTAIVTLSLGELSSRGDLETRANEAEQAAQILGICHRESLNLPDGELGSDYSETANQQLSAVVNCLRKLRPDIVLAPYHSAIHPDHSGSNELITKAIYFAALDKFEPNSKHSSFSPLQVIYYQERVQFTPSFITDISGVASEKKATIECYRSQFGLDEIDGPQTVLTTDYALSAIEARDRYYGAMIGKSHGEPYYISNALSLADPVKHFRENANLLALYTPERQL